LLVIRKIFLKICYLGLLSRVAYGANPDPGPLSVEQKYFYSSSYLCLPLHLVIHLLAFSALDLKLFILGPALDPAFH
jgi:hypothetical protein